MSDGSVMMFIAMMIILRQLFPLSLSLSPLAVVVGVVYLWQVLYFLIVCHARVLLHWHSSEHLTAKRNSKSNGNFSALSFLRGARFSAHLIEAC